MDSDSDWQIIREATIENYNNSNKELNDEQEAITRAKNDLLVKQIGLMIQELQRCLEYNLEGGTIEVVMQDALETVLRDTSEEENALQQREYAYSTCVLNLIVTSQHVLILILFLTVYDEHEFERLNQM